MKLRTAVFIGGPADGDEEHVSAVLARRTRTLAQKVAGHKEPVCLIATYALQCQESTGERLVYHYQSTVLQP